MNKHVMRLIASFAVAFLAFGAMASVAFAAEAYPAQSTFTYLQVTEGEDLQVNALNFQGDIGEVVFLEVDVGGAAIAKNLPHTLGASDLGADVSGSLTGDVFVITGDAATIEDYLARGLTVTAYSDRAGTVLLDSTPIYGVHAVASDGSFSDFLIGTYTQGAAFSAPDTIVVGENAYTLESFANDVCTYAPAQTADTVNGKITYYDVKTGELLEFETPINGIEFGEIRSVDVPETITAGGTLYRTLSYMNPLTAGYPGQTTFSVPCVKVEDISDEIGHYLATINMVDQDGNLIASDSVYVAGAFAYAPPTAIYKTRMVNGESEVFAYENPTWEGQNEGDTAIMFDAATDGITTGSRTITVAYSQTQGDIEYEVQFNLIDGAARVGSNLLDTYTDDKLTVSAVNKSVSLADAQEDKSKLEVDGNTYNIVGSTSDYSYAFDSGEAPVVDVYYLPDGYEPENDEPYEVTIRYVNYATNEVIATETAESSPAQQSNLQINAPEEFTESGVTYVRLDGQERPISHNYYSNVREYTVYYRDVNDTLSANTVITNVRTVYRTTTGAATTGTTATGTTTTGTTTAPAATATAPTATATATDAAPATTPATAATNPSTDYTVAEGDNTNSALTTPNGTDANQERIDDTANPLADGIEGNSAIDGNAPGTDGEQAKPALPSWLIAVAVAAVAGVAGLIAFLLRKRNGGAAGEQSAEEGAAEQPSSDEQ